MNVPGHPNGVVFTGSASDGDIDPYHGWLIGYDAKTLKLVTFFNATPNGDFGGIWQGGAAPSVLPNGDLLLGTGNGTFDAFTTTTPPGAAAQGEGGFGLGSSGLGQSAAVPFAASIPSTGVSSTGLFFNGDTTTDQPRRARRLPAAGRDRHRLHGGGRGPQRPGHLPGDPLVQRHHALRDDHRRDHRRHLQPRLREREPPRDRRRQRHRFRRLRRRHRRPDVDHCDHELDLLQRRPDLDRPLRRLRQQRRRDGHRGHEVQRHRGRRDDRGRPAGGKPFRQQPRQYRRTSRRRSTSRFSRIEPDHAGWRRPELHHPERPRPRGRPGLRRVVPPSSSRPPGG